MTQTGSHLDDSADGEASHQTIFSLGARRYWEDPTTQLLAFFLDSSQGHKQGSRFLKCLLQAANLPTAPFVDIKQVTTQLRVPANEGGADKIIDIYIETANRIIVIENKIWANFDNPLSDYARFAEREALRLGKNGPPTLIILSIQPIDPNGETQGWSSVLYKDFIHKLRIDGEKTHFSKQIAPRWSVLSKEFIDHLALEAKAFSPEQISTLLKQLILGNAGTTIGEVKSLLTSYVDQELKAKLRDDTILVKFSEWNDADTDKGWSGGEALDCQVAESFFSGNAVLSLALPIGAGRREACAPPLKIIVWIKHQNEEGLRLSASLLAHGFHPLLPSEDIRWSAGLAFELSLGNVELDVAVAHLAHWSEVARKTLDAL